PVAPVDAAGDPAPLRAADDDVDTRSERRRDLRDLLVAGPDDLVALRPDAAGRGVQQTAAVALAGADPVQAVRIQRAAQRHARAVPVAIVAIPDDELLAVDLALRRDPIGDGRDLDRAGARGRREQVPRGLVRGADAPVGAADRDRAGRALVAARVVGQRPPP